MDRFPGLLGSGGILAIHADWPNYPLGIGYEYALKAIGNYPKGTELFEISDIDRCKLFINKKPEHLDDPFNSHYYHCAIWHQDLLELLDKGFVHGVEKSTEYQFEMMRYDELKDSLAGSYTLDEKGNIAFNSNPPLTYFQPEYDEVLGEYYTCAIIKEKLILTELGWEELKQLMTQLSFHSDVEFIVRDLINIRRYDTAIREASLLVESSIKQYHGVKAYGQRLIDFHINQIIVNNDKFQSAAIKSYRNELRTIFSFIRNDFMHNFKEITEVECQAILARINSVYEEFIEVVEVYR